MSGGHFGYSVREIKNVGEAIEALIEENDDTTPNRWGEPKGCGYPPEIIAKFREAALALKVAHAERSEAMSHGARLEAEIIAFKAEQNDLRIKIAIIRQDSNREFEDYRIERDQLRVALLDIARLKTEGDALRKDAERLDWLDQNIFSRENINFMGQLDPTMNMWVTFAPKGHQGSARNILDAAMQAQTVQS